MNAAYDLKSEHAKGVERERNHDSAVFSLGR